MSVVEKKLLNLVDAGLPAFISLVYEYITSCIAKAERGLSGMCTMDLNIRTRAPSSNHDLVMTCCYDIMWMLWLRSFNQVCTAVPLLSCANRSGLGGGGLLARGSGGVGVSCLEAKVTAMGAAADTAAVSLIRNRAVLRKVHV